MHRQNPVRPQLRASLLTPRERGLTAGPATTDIRGRRARGVAVTLVAAVIAGGAAAVTGLVLRDGPSGDTAAAPQRAPVTAADAALLERAEQELVRQCMARAGFRYWPTAPAPDPMPFTYVVDDIAWADTFGYGTSLQRAAEARAAADPNRRYFESLPPARQQAAVDAVNGPTPSGLSARLPNGLLVNHSDRGCSSEAQRTLYGDLAAWYASTKVTENLAGERFGRVISDARLRAALPGWSACMRRAGYAFATPEDAHAAMSAAEPPPAPGAERRQAGAEARCAVATGLGVLARRLDGEQSAGQQERYRTLLATRDAQQRHALPAAERLVAGS